MQKFSTWLEQAMYNNDLSNLEGDPYMDVEWKEMLTYQNTQAKLLNLKIRYRWKGYSILPHHWTGPRKKTHKPDEFASVELHQLHDHPNYFYLDGIGTADPFQREGYGTALLKKALELIKAKGFKGIVSSVDGNDRSDDGDALWKSLKTRCVGEFDVYE